MRSVKLNLEGLESRATPSSLAAIPVMGAANVHYAVDPPVVEPGGGVAEPPVINPDWTEEDWILDWIEFWLEFLATPPSP